MEVLLQNGKIQGDLCSILNINQTKSLICAYEKPYHVFKSYFNIIMVKRKIIRIAHFFL